MTAVAEAGTTTVDRLACTVALPRDTVDVGALRARLERASGSPLADALGSVLSELDGADPGAVWVVRSLSAEVVVPAGELDVDRLAVSWAGQLADSILEVLRRGPGGNVVRFASPTEHLAAFVFAQATGRSDGWMFSPFAGLRMLPPLTALLTGAKGAGTPILDVMRELAARRRLEVVLSSATPAQAALVWAACLSPGAVASAPAVERVINALPAAVVAASARDAVAVRALRLLAAVAPTVDVTPSVAAAIDVIAKSHGPGQAPAMIARQLVPEARPDGGPTDVPSMLTLAPRAPRAGPADAIKPPSAADGEVVVGQGAAAFLALPSMEAVGFGALPPVVRVRVLTRLLGLEPDESDPALHLAAGMRAPEKVKDGVDAVTAALLRGLVDDDRLDGATMVRTVVQHPDGERAVALLRDATTETWLSGAVAADAASIDWDALTARAATVLGAPAVIDVVPDAWRDPASDVAWLRPADGDDLACGLVARAGLHHLARRLLGFERASMSYLIERFAPPGGVVAVTPACLHVELVPPPLSVVLVMAGLDTFGYSVPWLDREVVVTHRNA
jgi:hypothetical protein